MKPIVVTFAALFAAATASLAQLSITSLDRNGTLSWSNRLCTSLPVYEVLHAGSPTGSWEHVAFITNQTSFTLPDFSGGAGAGYYKLAWVSHAPIEFDYVFDEGYGFPAVIGRLSLAFTSGSGLWAFEETDFVIDGLHPVGAAQVSRMQLSGNLLRVYLQPILDGGVFLEGTLQSTEDSSGCVYTSYFGMAYEADFSGGGTPIGTFIGTKIP
jgi:hypothetical protein